MLFYHNPKTVYDLKRKELTRPRDQRRSLGEQHVISLEYSKGIEMLSGAEAWMDENRSAIWRHDPRGCGSRINELRYGRDDGERLVMEKDCSNLSPSDASGHGRLVDCFIWRRDKKEGSAVDKLVTVDSSPAAGVIIIIIE